MDESGYKTPDISSFVPCSICGRTFNPDVLTRHEKVCSKLKQSDQKRKPFDMSRKRAEGTDLEKFMKENLLYNNDYNSPKQPSKKKANWRSKHQQFVNSIRSARVVTKALATGAPLPPHEPSAPDPDYVQCPYCERRFQESTAERHIPFCKEKAARIPPSSKAKDAQNKRIAYKPPAVTKRRSGAVQDSSSNPPGFSVVKKNSNFSAQSDQEDEENMEEAPPTGNKKPFRPAKPLARATQGQQKASHIPISSSGTLSKKTTAFSMGPDKGDIDNIENQPIPDPPQVAKTTQSMTSRKLYAALEYSEGKGLESPPIKSISSAPDHTSIADIPPSPTNTNNSSRSKPRTRKLSHLNGNGPLEGHQQREVSAGSLRTLSGTRHIPLNEHGMPMSKFCYECGTKFPVPQAKYCSECGTKRL